ncbi:MAG: hypothetical protein JWM80_6654, partial [Cyanobacteria bacterium RYN_339]|nr:hypothetical protein [Cyanobacteria bacterium RYN_339]
YRANEVRFNELIEKCVMTGEQIAAFADAFNSSYLLADVQERLHHQRKVLAALAQAASWTRR